MRLRRNAKQVTGTTVDQKFTLPFDCREVTSLSVTYANLKYELPPLGPEALSDTLNGYGIPAGYVVVSEEIDLFGLPVFAPRAVLVGGNGEYAYTLTYRPQIPLLTDTEPTTPLLLGEPGIYLYAALMEASPYLGDDARAATWAALYKNIADELTKEDDNIRFGNTPSMRLPIYAP